VTQRGRIVAASVALALAVFGAALAALVRAWPARVPGVPPELVPASWEQYRTSAGHVAHVGSGKAACRDCHDVEHRGFENPGAAPCARCHAQEATHTHNGHAGHTDGGSDATGCLTCHPFAPDVEPPTCIGCHAKVEGHAASVKVHATADCLACHRVHEEPSIVPKDCATCHDERATEHARHAGAKGCLDCHTGHAPAAAALATCSRCHAQPTVPLRPRPAGDWPTRPKPAGHDSCVGCHAPHTFTATPGVCAGCHAPKPTLAATQVPAHAACTSCHAPHAPSLAAESCGRCHASVHVAHGSKGACVECHEPHGEAAETRSVDACTSCHGGVALSDTGAHAGGIACQSCHKPHDFAPPDRRTLCADCHATEATLASANKGHSDCSPCHGASAHTPAAAPACGTCHKQEQASAPAGHQKCTGCHDAHGGSVRPLATCVSCHTEKMSGPHVGVAGGCETCHRPHGPGEPAAPPTCTSCHTRDRLPALHEVPAHADCKACHSSHEAPRADRATCTGSCHTNRRDHQPQAALCAGCHVFRQ
jgi:hypothetical protein